MLAARLQRELPIGCSPARLSGDEFVVGVRRRRGGRRGAPAGRGGGLAAARTGGGGRPAGAGVRGDRRGHPGGRGGLGGVSMPRICCASPTPPCTTPSGGVSASSASSPPTRRSRPTPVAHGGRAARRPRHRSAGAALPAGGRPGRRDPLGRGADPLAAPRARHALPRRLHPGGRAWRADARAGPLGAAHRHQGGGRLAGATARRPVRAWLASTWPACCPRPGLPAHGARRAGGERAGRRPAGARAGGDQPGVAVPQRTPWRR